MTDAARLAARNNAEWCDAVCRARGSTGRFSAPLWLNLHPTPPYYPNAVTLQPDAVEAQMEAVAALRQALPTGFAVKDSFAALDLAPQGFAPLFQATWIRRAPGRVPKRPDAGLEWEPSRPRRLSRSGVPAGETMQMRSSRRPCCMTETWS